MFVVFHTVARTNCICVVASADIISLCIDLLKSRVDWLKAEQTHTLVGSVFLPLVDRTHNVKVVTAIVHLTHAILKSAGQVGRRCIELFMASRTHGSGSCQQMNRRGTNNGTCALIAE